jgi:hypothetical protein
VKKGATLHERKGELFLSSSSLTTDGVWIDSEPFCKIPAESDSKLIGDAIINAINSSRQGVPHPGPNQWSSVIAPLLALASAKSYGAFMKNSRCLVFTLDGDTIKMIPSKNLGPKGGFEPLPADTISVPFTSPAESIGDSVKKCLEKCE